MSRFRFAVLALLLTAWSAGSVLAQSWSDGLFEETARDFGTVPKGPLLTHPFRVTNHTTQTVRISALRVSCGCTTATALQGTLSPGQTTVLLAQMDTRRFTGPRTVTIYVQFDQPESREVHLSVTANSQDQLSVTPETLSFGSVSKGGSATGEVIVSMRGDANWRITQTVSGSTFVEPTLTELARSPAEVRYALRAKLKPGVPAGKWFTDIWLTTNASGSSRVHVPITVEVRAALTVSPATVSFGEVHVETETQRKVLLQGSKPFSIVSVTGGDEELSARIDRVADGAVQGLTLTLKPGSAGSVRRTLKVTTDLPEEGEVEVPIHAEVAK